MANNPETGHAKNVANLQELIAFITSYGATYNPPRNAIKLTQLSAILASSQKTLADVIVKNTEFNNKIIERTKAFATLKPLSTRLVNTFEGFGIKGEKLKDAKGFHRKLQGQRAKAIIQPLDPEEPKIKTNSASQMSYDQQIQHFAALIEVLKSEPTFIPNEADLKIASLIAKQADLVAKNTAVDIAYSAVNNARLIRDTTIYHHETGLVSIALDAKKYIRGIYGSNSLQFAQIKGIPFRGVRV